MVQYDTSAVMITITTGCSALLYCMCDAHVCGGVKWRASHDLKIGRVHRVGSMKGEKRGERGCLIYARKRYRGLCVGWLAGTERGERERQAEMERGGRGREAKRACVFYGQSSNYGIAHSTLSYIQRGHTQRSSSLIPAMTCPSVSHFD
jgi:hypothetical protein